MTRNHSLVNWTRLIALIAGILLVTTVGFAQLGYPPEPQPAPATADDLKKELAPIHSSLTKLGKDLTLLGNQVAALENGKKYVPPPSPAAAKPAAPAAKPVPAAFYADWWIAKHPWLTLLIVVLVVAVLWFWKPIIVGVRRYWLVILLITTIGFATTTPAVAAPVCYNPKTGPSNLPVAVVGQVNTINCPGIRAGSSVEVVDTNGVAIPISGSAQSFTLTPARPARATIKANGKAVSMLYIGPLDQAVAVNASVDMARQAGTADKKADQAYDLARKAMRLVALQPLVDYYGPEEGRKMYESFLAGRTGPEEVYQAIEGRRINRASQSATESMKSSLDQMQQALDSLRTAASQVRPAPEIDYGKVRGLARNEAEAVVAPVRDMAERADTSAGLALEVLSAQVDSKTAKKQRNMYRDRSVAAQAINQRLQQLRGSNVPVAPPSTKE